MEKETEAKALKKKKLIIFIRGKKKEEIKMQNSNDKTRRETIMKSKKNKGKERKGGKEIERLKEKRVRGKTE